MRMVRVGRPGRLAHGPLDEVGDGRAQHAEIDIGHVEIIWMVLELGQFVADQPNVVVPVHFDVGWIFERGRVFGHYSRVLGRHPTVATRIPATDRVLVNERVYHGPRRFVQGQRIGLHAGQTLAQVLELVKHVRNGFIRLQRPRVNREHHCAGHRLKRVFFIFREILRTSHTNICPNTNTIVLF